MTEIDSSGRLEASPLSAETAKGELSFELVFDQYYQRVFYFFRYKRLSPQEAEDLTQETFLRVYEHLEGIQSPAALRSWIFRITENVWKNRVRDQKTQKRAHEEEALDDLPEGAAMAVSTPAEQERLILDEERREQLHRAVAELAPRMRQCLLMRLEQGHKYKVIADLLKVKIDTVKAQLHQAKEILKRKLGDYFEIPADLGDDEP